MTTRVVPSTGVLFLILSVFTCANAQEGKKIHIQGPVAWLKSGISVAFTTDAVYPEPRKRVSSMISLDANVIHRVLIDKHSGLYFGYDLEIEPIPDSKQFRVTIKPLSPDFQQHLREESDFRIHHGNTAMPLIESFLPQYPTAQIVVDGDTIALDLFFNQKTGIKLVDMIKISSEEFPMPARLR